MLDKPVPEMDPIKYTLCDFDETVQWFLKTKTKIVVDKCKYWIPSMKTHAEVPDDDDDDYDDDDDDDEKYDPENYSILCALVFRIEVCYSMIEAISPWVSSDIAGLEYDEFDERFQWRLHTATHLDLAYHMENTNEYTDKVLREQLLDTEMSTYQRYKPRAHRFFWCGDLPNLVYTLKWIDWFGGFSKLEADPEACVENGFLPAQIAWCTPANTTSNILGKIRFLKLLLKVKPGLCHFKKWREEVEEHCSVADAGIYELQILILRCSLFGLYPHCEITPSFPRQLNLMKLFSCDAIRSRKDIIQWCSEHDKLVWFAWKEYLVFLMRYNPGIRDVLVLSRNWLPFERSTCYGMDIARHIFDEQGVFEGEMYSTNKELHTVYTDRQVKKVWRSQKDTFLNCLVASLNKIFDQKFVEYKGFPPDHEVDKENSPCAHPYSLISPPVQDFVNTDNLNRTEMDQIIDYVSRFSPGDRIQREDFEIWGVDPKLVEQLVEMWENYDHCDAFYQGTRELLYMLFWYASPYDFHRIHAIAYHLKEHFQVRWYSTTKNTFDRQYDSLRARYRLHDWEDTPEDIFYVYFCSSCRSLACRVMKDGSSPDIVHEIGVANHAAYDWEKDALYGKSAQTKSQQAAKNRRSDKEQPDDRRKYTERKAKQHRRSVFFPGCNNQKLHSLFSPGMFWRIGHTTYTLCERCGIQTVFNEISASDPNGITCPPCRYSAADELTFEREEWENMYRYIEESRPPRVIIDKKIFVSKKTGKEKIVTRRIRIRTEDDHPDMPYDVKNECFFCLNQMNKGVVSTVFNANKKKKKQQKQKQKKYGRSSSSSSSSTISPRWHTYVIFDDCVTNKWITSLVCGSCFRRHYQCFKFQKNIIWKVSRWKEIANTAKPNRRRPRSHLSKTTTITISKKDKK